MVRAFGAHMWSLGALLHLSTYVVFGAISISGLSWELNQLQVPDFEVTYLANLFEFCPGIDFTLYCTFVSMLGAKISHEIVNSSVVTLVN